jgi:hypothetical protein
VVLGSGTVVALSAFGALMLPPTDNHVPAVKGQTIVLPPSPDAPPQLPRAGGGPLPPLVPQTTAPTPNTGVTLDGLLSSPTAHQDPAVDLPPDLVVGPRRGPRPHLAADAYQRPFPAYPALAGPTTTTVSPPQAAPGQQGKTPPPAGPKPAGPKPASPKPAGAGTGQHQPQKPPPAHPAPKPSGGPCRHKPH